MSFFLRRTLATLCAAAGMVLSSSEAGAQNPTLQGHPEDYVRADIEYGARLYTEHCFSCHGGTGDGVAGVDVRSGKFRNARTDPQLRTVITNGFPNTGMPAFKLDPTELAGIVAYLRNRTCASSPFRRSRPCPPTRKSSRPRSWPTSCRICFH